MTPHAHRMAERRIRQHSRTREGFDLRPHHYLGEDGTPKVRYYSLVSNRDRKTYGYFTRRELMWKVGPKASEPLKLAA